jgi:putative copper resistance protein D
MRWPLAGAAILIVLGLGVGSALWRRRRRFAVLTGGGSIVCALAIAAPALTVDAYPSTYHPTAASYDTASVVAGARLYGALCAQCHGVRGQGDGPLAANLKPAPADLTAPHLGWHTHGDMYWWITHGYPGSAMPAFESETTEFERWQIVNYLMALSLGHQARTLSERPVPNGPWLAAINFRYASAGGGFAQLSELQLNAPALLVLIRDAAELSRLDSLARQANSLAETGLKVIVVLAPQLRRPDSVPADVEIVCDVDGEIFAAWSHYRRTLAQPDFRDELPEPARMEVLMDRYGYVRARWRGDEGAMAPTTDALHAALETLAMEPAFPVADVHAH